MIKTGLVTEPSRINGIGGLFINYKGSSSVEKVGYRGLSHLAEHLLCKSYDHLNDRLRAAAVEANAYTSDSEVVFFWTGLDDQIENFQSELLKLINFLPTKDQFEIERNIVIQEFNIASADKYFIVDNIARKYFDYFSPIGAIEDLKAVTYEEMIRFMKEYFSKPTSIVRLGKTDTIGALVDGISFAEPPVATIRPLSLNEGAVYFPSEFPTSKAICNWQTFTKNEVDFRDIHFMNLMWADGLNSPFYQEIREKRGLSYGMFFHLKPLSEIHHINYFICECNPESEVEIQSILTGLRVNWRDHLTKDRFNNVLAYTKNQTAVDQLTKYKSINRFLTDNYISLEYLNSLTFEKIMATAEAFMGAEWNLGSVSKETVI